MGYKTELRTEIAQLKGAVRRFEDELTKTIRYRDNALIARDDWRQKYYAACKVNGGVEIGALKVRVQQLDEQLGQMTQWRDNTYTNMEKYREEKDTLKEKLAHAEQWLATVRGAEAEMSGKHYDLLAKIRVLNAERDRDRGHVDELEHTIADLGDDLRKAESAAARCVRGQCRETGSIAELESLRESFNRQSITLAARTSELQEMSHRAAELNQKLDGYVEWNDRQARTIAKQRNAIQNLQGEGFSPYMRISTDRLLAEREQQAKQQDIALKAADAEIKGLRSMLAQKNELCDTDTDRYVKELNKLTKRIELRDADLDGMQARYAELAADNRALQQAHSQAKENVEAAISQRNAAEGECADLRERVRLTLVELQAEQVWKPRFLDKQEDAKGQREQLARVEAGYRELAEDYTNQRDALATAVNEKEVLSERLEDCALKAKQYSERVLALSSQVNAQRKQLHNAAQFIGALESL